MIRLYIDTEFSDFWNYCELISIGIVSDDGREFYCECSDFDPAHCTDFVRAAVLPILDRSPETTCTADELKVRLKSWMKQFDGEETVATLYDYEYDWLYFDAILEGEFLQNLRRKNIGKELDRSRLEEYFEEDSSRHRHHALHDARANCYAHVGF